MTTATSDDDAIHRALGALRGDLGPMAQDAANHSVSRTRSAYRDAVAREAREAARDPHSAQWLEAFNDRLVAALAYRNALIGAGR